MRGMLKRTAAIAIGGLVAAVAIAVPASADFKAYDYNNYISLLVSSAPVGKIDVADNRTASVRNSTDRRFSGRNFGLLGTHQEIFSFGPWGSYSTLGSANDKIDFFERK